jgi:hypothetical protein
MFDPSTQNKQSGIWTPIWEFRYPDPALDPADVIANYPESDPVEKTASDTPYCVSVAALIWVLVCCICLWVVFLLQECYCLCLHLLSSYLNTQSELPSLFQL